MIQRIEATSRHKINEINCSRCYGKVFTWDRNTIGNIIENVPKLIKLDGWWEDIKIIKFVKKQKDEE